jgi:hypothetical protein
MWVLWPTQERGGLGCRANNGAYCTFPREQPTPPPGCAADICDARIAAISTFLEEELIVGQKYRWQEAPHRQWQQGWERESLRLRFGTQAAAVENGISILRSRQSQMSYSGHQQSKVPCNPDVTLFAEDPTTTR